MAESGNRIAIVGAGPSLHAADVELIRQSGIFTIVVNSAWKHAPFANVLFAGDASWWVSNHEGITIPAERWCCSKQATTFRADYFEGMSGWNSGANAIMFAIREKKATSIILTGFDCSLRNGVHVHGLHPNNRNPCPRDVGFWHGQFQQVAGMAKMAGVPLLNCSRYTEIQSIQRADLAEVINGGRI